MLPLSFKFPRMLTDNQTNILYLSDWLQKDKKFAPFLERFKAALKEKSIIPKFLLGTKDIWAVDYMPIQVKEDKFVQFIYDPDYLKNEKNKEYRTDPANVRYENMQKSIPCDIVLDGGNVIKGKNKVILCDKVFSENKGIEEKELIRQLSEIFEVDKVIFVPWDKEGDAIGHADALVRFLDEDRVFINDFSGEDPEYATSFRLSLHNAGLECIEVPYYPYDNDDYDDATGLYLNYLQMGETVFLPIFGIQQDDEAIKVFKKYFKDVVPIMCNEIAGGGGLLNCISWNIKQ